MQFYGFRFFTAYEAMARHLEHQAEARRALGEPLEWTDSTDDVLEEPWQTEPTREVPDPQKIDAYLSCAEAAYHLAKERLWDIVLSDASGPEALIILRGDSIFFVRRDRAALTQFIKLLTEAYEIYLEPENDMLELRLVYSLCVPNPK